MDVETALAPLAEAVFTGSGVPRGLCATYDGVLFRLVRGLLDFRKVGFLAILVSVEAGGYVPDFHNEDEMTDLRQDVIVGFMHIGRGQMTSYGVRVEPFVIPAISPCRDVAVVLTGVVGREGGRVVGPLISFWAPGERVSARRGELVTVRCTAPIVEFEPRHLAWRPEEG
jgi:hypothetical protein